MTQAISGQPAASEARATRLFFLAITVYYILQIVHRLIMGGGLEADDGEMLMMTPGLQWGYGPQLPFYNWLQVAVFAITGKTLFGITLLKHLLLWTTFALLFIGLRAWLPAKQAAIATLSLFLIPDIAWEADRVTTHSNAMLAAISGTFAAFLWTTRTGHWRDWALLGVAVGIGGISKYNYWVVPAGLVLAALTIPVTRRQLANPRVLIVPGIAATIVAGPYLWMSNNAELAMASAHKLHLDKAPPALLPKGVVEYLGGLVAQLLLPLIVFGLIKLVSRRSAPVPETTPWVSSLLYRMGLISVVSGLAIVWISGAGAVTTRWLLPLVIPIILALYIRLSPRLSRAGKRVFFIAVTLLAISIFAGLTYDRYKEGARRDFDFEGLAQDIEAMDLPEDTVIVTGFYLGGNIALLRPDWSLRSSLPSAAADMNTSSMLVMSRYDQDLYALAQRSGWPFLQGATATDKKRLDMQGVGSDAIFPVYYMRFEAPPNGK